MIRFFIVPQEVSGVPGATRTGAKYFAYRGDPDPPALVAPGPATDYLYFGDQPWVIVACDMDDATANLLGSQPDVVRFPDDLDAQIGADLPAFQAELDMIGIPGPILGAGDRYRRMLRGIRGIYAIIGCMRAKGFDPTAADLDTVLSSLSAPARQALKDCAVEYGYSAAGITNNSTIREVYRSIAAQTKPWTLLGVQV